MPPPRIRNPRQPSHPLGSSSFASFLFLLSALILLTLPSPTLAQSQIASLALPSLTTHPLPRTNTTPLLLSLLAPTKPTQIYLSFSLCSVSDSFLLPSIFISNSSDVPVPSKGNLKERGEEEGEGWKSEPKNGVWWEPWDEGYGNWTGWVGGQGEDDHLRVAIWSRSDGEEGEVEVGISSSSFIHIVSPSLPVLADTTSSNFLLFSPPFASASPDPPIQTYPNYTLPPPTYPATPPSQIPSHTLYILPSSSYSVSETRLSKSQCGVRKSWDARGLKGVRSNGTVVEGPNRMGWRQMMVGEGGDIVPGGNYTAWVVRDNSLDAGVAGGGVISGPQMFVMKSSDFPCPLAYSLSICPSISYAAALDAPANDGPNVITELPSSLNNTITEFLESFATTLSTYACGRDNYSPVSTCEDCYNAYRDWLCGVMIPRCGENPTITPPPPNDRRPFPTPALLPRDPSSPRFPNASTPSYPYTELLPCLESCHIVDRICPVFLGFRCPKSGGGRTGLGTARESYGVELARAVDGDGRWVLDEGRAVRLSKGGDDRSLTRFGMGARAGNEYGEVWCNLKEGFVG